MLSTLHNKTLAKRRGSDQGFTLIELLVVIVIIGILAAIAIPAFLNQRQSARDASVTSDVRNAATEIQTAFAKYPDANYFAVAPGEVTTNTDAKVATHIKGDANNKITFFVGNKNGYDAVIEYTAVPAKLSSGGRIYISGVSNAAGNGTVPGEYVISAFNPSGKAFNSASNALVWNSAEGGLQN